MHYIALLFKFCALHYTLLSKNFKQTKLVCIDTFITAHNTAGIIPYGKLFTFLIFNSMFYGSCEYKSSYVYRKTNVIFNII